MIRLDIISGFLGVGKTTLINRIAEYCRAHGERCVYVVNEYGQSDVDAGLMRTENDKNGDVKTNVYEITGGCVCCTLRLDFISTLEEIVRTNPPDRILFEPSGVFMLSQIFELVNDSYAAEFVYIGSVVAAIDAAHASIYTREVLNVVKNQIANCNVVYISKLDRTPENLPALLEWLALAAPGVPVIAPQDGVPTDEDLEEILMKKHDARREKKSYWQNLIRHDSHKKFESVSLVPREFIDRAELEKVLDTLLSGSCGEIMRAKGFARCGGKTHVFQCVGNTVEITELENSEEAARTAVIGLHIKKKEIQKLFN